jgi:hypothetical protein
MQVIFIHGPAAWRTAFQEAARFRRPFIFTFHPEASVEPALIAELVDSIETAGGTVLFVELICANEATLERLGNSSREKFRKLTDVDLYQRLEKEGAFRFPPLPKPFISINTNELTPDAAANRIAHAIKPGGCDGSENR